jgi:hypothetical protein
MVLQNSPARLKIWLKIIKIIDKSVNMIYITYTRLTSNLHHLYY